MFFSSVFFVYYVFRNGRLFQGHFFQLTFKYNLTPLNTQCLQNSTESGERSALTSGSLRPAVCGIQREAVSDGTHSTFIEENAHLKCWPF